MLKKAYDMHMQFYGDKRQSDFQVMEDKKDFILVIWSNVTYLSCVIFRDFTVFEALGPIPGFCGCYLFFFTDLYFTFI
jgi:hypothetical protein